MDDDDNDRGRPALSAWLRVLLRNPRDTLLVVLAAGALIAILVNALFLQPGPHPAPIFAVRALPVMAPAPEPTGALTVLPRPRPPELQAIRSEQMATRSDPKAEVAARPQPARPEPAALRMRGEIIADLQRELAKRGYYDGTLDGLYGAKTDAALRDFERHAGLAVGVEPSEALLQAILRAPAKGKAAAPPPAPAALPAARAPAAPAPLPANAAVPVARAPVPPASLPTSPLAAASGNAGPPPSPPSAATSGMNLASMPSVSPPDQPSGLVLPAHRVMAVQRTLSDYGYGQVKPTGVYDPATRSAIEVFEGARKLPVTGQITDRLMRELGKMAGHPLD